MEEKGKNSNDLRETCFGKIVEGTAILDFMASHHEKNFHGMSMIGIETVRVIQSVEDPVADPRLPPRSKTSSSHRW